MTFKELNEALIPRAESLCALLLPGGRRDGQEWIAGGTEGDKGRSLKVKLQGAKAGVWKDFATDEGGDLIKLIEKVRNTDPKGAATFARDWLGMEPWAPDKNSPPPFDPLTITFRRTKGTAAWTYRDAKGSAFCHAVRFDFEDGKKDVIPMRLIDGKWSWKGFAAPLKPPIYGLDRLAARPDAPVLILEGEKTTDAASKLFSTHVCITWLGGCKAVRKVDWSALVASGRSVTLWPDADEPGRKAMAYLHQLIPGAVMVATTELPDGWDVADPAPDGIDVHGMLDGAAAAAAVRKAKLEVKEKEEAAKEEKAKYHLPAGCKLSEVEGDILKYKVFEHRGQVYAMRNNWATEVSNSTVQVHRHVPTKDGAVALVTLRNQNERDVLTLDVPFDVFSTGLAFVKWLGNQGNFQWWGTDLDFIGYKRKQMDQMKKCTLITELGTYEPGGFFTFNNAAVGPDGTVELDADGCFEYRGRWYYVPSGSAFYAKDAGAYYLQKMVTLSKPQVDFTTWSKQMVRVFGEHAYMPIVFTIATLFSGHIFRMVGGFPVIFLNGPGGSGKDRIIKACQGWFGTPQPEIFLTGPNTDKGLIKMFDEFCDVILNLAEYRKGLKKDMDELLKSLWGRIGYRMAAMRGKKTETIGIRCTAMVSGNDMPTDNALLRRLMVDVVEKKAHTDEDIKEFQTLQAWLRDGYSNIMAEFYTHRKDFEANWYTHFKASRATLIEAMGEVHVDSAILDNMQTLHGTMSYFVAKGMNFGFTADQLAGYMAVAMTRQLEMRSEGSEVSTFWTCFVYAHKRGLLLENRDFKISGNDITFYWGDVYAAYAATHAQVFGERGERTGDMRTKLQRHPCFVEAAKSSRIGESRNSSAMVCNMSKTGTNLKKLLSGLDKFNEGATIEDVFGPAPTTDKLKAFG